MRPVKKIEIFCGTGGVGKTTLATSRALYLSKNYKVLLVTIDPSKRLKQILHLENDSGGQVHQVKGDLFGQNFQGQSFDALLMNPKATLLKMQDIDRNGNTFNNPVLNILTRPYGGMNEILSLIEVMQRLKDGNYDCIVLDTPPGKHFIDFLNAGEKINQFFDKGFLEVFKYLGKTWDKTPKKFLTLIVSTGIKKILHYLEKVTGDIFVEQFIDAISTIYRNKEQFTQALSFQAKLKKKDFSNWFLITSVEQQKIVEAKDLSSAASTLMHDDSYLIINKCLQKELDTWFPDKNLSSDLWQLRESMLQREKKLKDYARCYFPNWIEFPEIIDPNPVEHVSKTVEYWEKQREV